MLQHSGRESKSNSESDSLFLSVRPLPRSFHFHSPLLLPLSALKQLPPLMQGTFQMTGGRTKKGRKGMMEVGRGGGGGARALGEGNKRLHNDCTTIQKPLKGHSSLGENVPLSSPHKKAHASIHQR